MTKHVFDANFTFSKIQDYSNDELISLSEEIKDYIVKTCSIYGGHLSSNLGVINLTLSLFKNFDFNKDKIIFDIGHSTYTYKILTGRPLKKLRQFGGTDGFQKISESIYDFYDAGHSSTSISAALAFAKARDLNKLNHEVIAVIGDGAIANGVCFEALNNLIYEKTKIIIVLNDNDMSITPTKGGVSSLLKKIKNSNKYNGIFDDANFEYIGVVDGDNFTKLEKAFSKAKELKKSVIIHVSTKKGQGYKYAQEDETGEYHFVHPFDIKTGKTTLKAPKNLVSFSKLFADLTENEIKTNKNSIAICPSTTMGSYLNTFFNKYKDRCFDTGISEEHSAIFATAFSLNNYHPYLFMYSTFLQRAYDEIIHDIARIGKGVTLLIDRSGLTGQDGETHQGIYDDSFFYSIPNIILSMPKDKKDAEALFNISKNLNKPMAIRFKANYLEKENVINKEVILNRWYNLKEGSKNNCIISFGPNLDDVYLALKDEDVTIKNAIFLKEYDKEEITNLLDYKKIFIYDPYGVETGFTSNLVLNLIKAGYKGQIFTKSIPLTYVDKGTIDEQETRVNVDVNSFISLYMENKN